MVNEMKKKLLIGALSVVPLSMLIYWFNLDNKLLYYGCLLYTSPSPRD